MILVFNLSYTKILFRKYPFFSGCRGVVSLSAEQGKHYVQKRESEDDILDWILANHSPTIKLLSNLVKRAESRRGNILFSKILRKLE